MAAFDEQFVDKLSRSLCFDGDFVSEHLSAFVADLRVANGTTITDHTWFVAGPAEYNDMYRAMHLATNMFDRLHVVNIDSRWVNIRKCKKMIFDDMVVHENAQMTIVLAKCLDSDQVATVKSHLERDHVKRTIVVNIINSIQYEVCTMKDNSMWPSEARKLFVKKARVWPRNMVVVRPFSHAECDRYIHKYFDRHMVPVNVVGINSMMCGYRSDSAAVLAILTSIDTAIYGFIGTHNNTYGMIHPINVSIHKKDVELVYTQYSRAVGTFEMVSRDKFEVVRRDLSDHFETKVAEANIVPIKIVEREAFLDKAAVVLVQMKEFLDVDHNEVMSAILGPLEHKSGEMRFDPVTNQLSVGTPAAIAVDCFLDMVTEVFAKERYRRNQVAIREWMLPNRFARADTALIHGQTTLKRKFHTRRKARNGSFSFNTKKGMFVIRSYIEDSNRVKETSICADSTAKEIIDKAMLRGVTVKGIVSSVQRHQQKFPTTKEASNS